MRNIYILEVIARCIQSELTRRGWYKLRKYFDFHLLVAIFNCNSSFSKDAFELITQICDSKLPVGSNLLHKFDLG